MSLAFCQGRRNPRRAGMVGGVVGSGLFPLGERYRCSLQAELRAAAGFGRDWAGPGVEDCVGLREWVGRG